MGELAKQPTAELAKRTFWQRVGSFFTGMTGWMTAAAGLIGAVFVVLTAVHVIGGNSGQPSTALRDWAASANDICARSNDAIAALPPPPSIGKNTKEAEDVIRSAVTIGRQMLRELEALTPPEGKEFPVTQFLRIGAEMNGVASEFLDDLLVGDSSGAQSRLAELSRVGTEFNSAAINLGATTCAEGGSLSDVFSSS